MSRNVIFVTICLKFALGLAFAASENGKFCIRTDPMLLDDIEKHVSPIEKDPHCEILATTLTAKEQKSFLNTMCKDLGTKNKEDYRYFKIRNGDLKGRGSYHDICKGTSSPFLAWIPYEQIQRHYATELNPKERMNYIGKATDVEREKTELCHFRHSDLVTNISENFFTCIVMIFEDNFYGLDANIQVLVELLPLMYEIQNITYTPWQNVTASYKTMLGKAVLKNSGHENKSIYGSINYAFVEKVRLNLSTVYGENLDKLPILFQRKEAVIELDNDGVGGVGVNEKAYFGRTMDAKTSVKVDVIGQWAEHRQRFNAEIHEYYGNGIKRFHSELHDGDVTFVLIESTEPVFEMPESTNLAKATLHKPQQKFERLTDGSSNNTAETADLDENGVDEAFDNHPHGEQPYPGFYPWFVISCLILTVVLLVVVYGMVRTCSKKEDKHKYKIAATT